MKDTASKIKDGIIRVENGQIVGLGYGGANPLDLSVLDTFMGETEKEGGSEALSNTIAGVCQVLAFLAANHPKVLEEVSPMLPSCEDIYRLNEVLKIFSK
ncbi:MAG TPA: hypothetical protein DHV48_12915 [Prolixibacteraceae bacterium]|nr:hypothetical protein [Prolixibacteraceae bacterium]